MALLSFVMLQIISMQKLKQVIKSNNIGFLRIHRHNRKILKRILAKENWNKLVWRQHVLRTLVKNDFLINSEDFRNAIAPFSQILKMGIKTWANPVILNQNSETIGKKLIIYDSNKMQPLLNASKAWQTILASSLKKREPSKIHPKGETTS